VAGILDGILEKMGIDVEQATTQELIGILQGIGDNAVLAAQLIGQNIGQTFQGMGQNIVRAFQGIGKDVGRTFRGIGENILLAATTIGENVVAGFNEGVLSGIGTIITTMLNVRSVIISEFKNLLGIASPSTVFMAFGEDIINGLIEGIRSMIGQLPDVIGEIGSVLAGAGAELLGSIFGGEAEGPSFAFDPAALLEGLTGVALFLTETLPMGLTALSEQFSSFLSTQTEALNLFVTESFQEFMFLLTETLPLTLVLLSEQFLLFFETQTEALNLLTTGPLQEFILALSSIYLMHLPTLNATWLTVTNLMMTQITATTATVNTLITTVILLQTTAVTMADTIILKMKEVAEKFKTLADNIKEKLIPAIEKATTAATKLAEALERAARARLSASGTSSAATGAAFQTGTPPSGFTIPPGFPNDTFPARFTSGETIFVFPRGKTPNFDNLLPQVPTIPRLKIPRLPLSESAIDLFINPNSLPRPDTSSGFDPGTSQKTSSTIGVAFQSGTSPGGFTIPPGFPNDTFPAQFTSGETIFAFPQGETPDFSNILPQVPTVPQPKTPRSPLSKSVKDIFINLNQNSLPRPDTSSSGFDLGTSQKTVINNFNQTVNTNAGTSTVIGDFKTMQLMLGS
jgi:hypothetical protein